MENERPKILVIDDEQSSLNAINRTLRKEFELILCLNGQTALQILHSTKVAAILSDQRMPEMSGVAVFQEAIKLQPDATRVMITGYTDIGVIVDAINDGKVFYYLSKPWEPEDLLLIMRQAVIQYELKIENRRLMQDLKSANEKLSTENTILQKQVKREYTFEHIIGNSPAMQQVFSFLQKVIPTDTTVLILGETGTGKELIASAIHYNGPRKDKLFVAQNCGALSDTLLESELFGHIKGAFTGATTDKKGLFEIANGGTIFLDEIGDTSQAMQQRLLRALQEGEITPVGSGKSIKVDVRILSAANRDLQVAVDEGGFRKDLYFRLNVFPLRIPPLRERKEDIPPLATFFLQKYAAKMSKGKLKFSQNALASLLQNDYPGNVRELENIVQRATTLADVDQEINSDLLNMNVSLNSAPQLLSKQANGDLSLKDQVEQLEQQQILQAMIELNGNITHVADKLGLSRLGLSKKLQRYEIDPSNYKQSKQ